MLKIGDNEPILIKARPKFGKDITFYRIHVPYKCRWCIKKSDIFRNMIFFMEHLNLKYESYHQGSALGPGSQRDPGPGIDFWTRDWDRD